MNVVKLTYVLIAAARQDVLVHAEDVTSGHVVPPASTDQVPHCRGLGEGFVLVAASAVTRVEADLYNTSAI